MSPLWRNRLLIALTPERVAVMRLKRGLRPKQIDRFVRDCGSVGDAIPAWAGVVSALGSLLTDLPPGGGDACVVLSNHFVRHGKVPWTTGIYSDRDREILAAGCFRAIHGDSVEHWRVATGTPHFGESVLAAAIDTDLIEGLRAILTRHNWQLAVLRPHLATAFDCWRKRLLADDGGFVVLESGCLTALFCRQGRWTDVSHRRYRQDVAEDPVRLLRQCIDTDSAHGGTGAIALWAPGMLRMQVEVSGNRSVRLLESIEDPWFGMAWSAV